jgi:TRAP transporter TAXI family solute receptor
VTDLGATPGLKIKLIDHSEVVPKMNAKYGELYVTDVIPAKTYPGQDKDNHNSTVWNILVSNEKMPDDMAYNIVKTIFDKKADLVAVHKEAENFDYKYQVKNNSSIPWHPGAEKYFKEKGLAF